MNHFSTLSAGFFHSLPILIPLSVFPVVFTSCAPNPQLQYDLLSHSPPDRVLSNKSQTIRFAPANRVILPFQQEFDFEENGDAINLGSYYSYFRVFRLDTDSGAVYKITARGLCDFWEGKVIIPLIYLLDEKGNVVKEGPSAFTLEKVFPGVSDDVIKSFEFSQARSGILHVLIAADNSAVGRTVGRVGTSSVVSAGNVTMTSRGGGASGLYTPVGTIRLGIDRVVPSPSRDANK